MSAERQQQQGGDVQDVAQPREGRAGRAPDPALGSAPTTRVLTPASLKLDSRVLFMHTTALWLSNAIFCIFLLGKFTPRWPNASWWLIFTPQFIGHGLHIPLLIWVIVTVKQRVLQQLGPPPPTHASLALHAHYLALQAVARRSHIIDNSNALLDSCALLAVKIQFALLLNNGTFASASMRVVFAPIWSVWAVTLVLVCMKHKRERVIGSQRDLAYVFLLMVAFKVDGQSDFPWQVVFIVPWIWLCGVLLLGVVVAVSLMCARGRARLKDLLMPIGFMMLLFSLGIPQFAFCRNLVAYLDDNTDITMESILIPAAIGWIAMWASSAVLAMGLYNRERARAALLASGAVWTAHEALARGLQPAAMREEEQQRIDAMNEEDVMRLAQQYMHTKGALPPAALVRVGPSLFKRPAGAGAAAAAVPLPALLAAATGSLATSSRGTTNMTSKLAAAQTSAAAPAVVPRGASDLATLSGGLQAGPEGCGPSSPSSTSAALALVPTHVAIELPPLGTHPPAPASPSPSAAAQRQSSGAPLGSGGGGGASPPAAHQQQQERWQQQQLLLPAGPGLGASSLSGLGLAALAPARAQATSSSGTLPGGAGSTAALPLPPRTPGILPALLQPSPGLAELLGMGTAPAPAPEDVDDGTCVICFDGQASCVLLECGHGGFCARCAHVLLVRPPNVCPTCRRPIDQVVQLESLNGVGQLCSVKKQAVMS